MIKVTRQFQSNEIISRLIPLGDHALLIRFGNTLDLKTNYNAQAFAEICRAKLGAAIEGCASNLVSVIVHYDPKKTPVADLKNQIMLLMSNFNGKERIEPPVQHVIDVKYGGDEGPCLAEVCETLGVQAETFVNNHIREPLHALALGFSPGFLYLGLHDEDMRVSRRDKVQENVPAGSILFAAGQTAITSRPIRTGWHVIGQSNFRNFDPTAEKPIQVNPGELVQFRAVNSL
ncbi:allophanate hydrolase [Maritalea porphyrae]|uniref:Allophanate hydrolase n=1 Tax=Maritalea porphyrae TaxID=880732 RepID=A0ABQ5UUL4_9HYPH|nr:allophanate hydrolase [Maritalea porphyrae]